MSIICPHCNEYFNGSVTECQECGEKFITIREAHYCSKKCKQKAYRGRKALKGISRIQMQEIVNEARAASLSVMLLNTRE